MAKQLLGKEVTAALNEKIKAPYQTKYIKESKRMNSSIKRENQSKRSRASGKRSKSYPLHHPCW